MTRVSATDDALEDGALTRSRLNLPGGRSGKVRDIYPLPSADGNPERLLIVATDRISAFDVVLPTPLPGKGRLLTEISVWWLNFIQEQGLATTHLLSTDPADLPDGAFGEGSTMREQLAGRIMIGRRCKVVPIECIVRGYLEGSGWKEYQQTGAICGIKLPAGLRQCDRLPEPIFTPTTKAEPPAHDEAVTFEQACEVVGRPLMETLRERSLAIYKAAAEHALGRGIIIADTKFEFGVPIDDGGAGSGGAGFQPARGGDTPDPILIDEALTPDSSRFWPADGYEPGRSQKSFDKQFVREYLQELVSAGRWNKTDPGPELPDEIVRKTLDKYAEAVRKLTG